jgi:hypothetical protein
MVVGGAAGDVIGKFARHKIDSGLEDKMGAALPPGPAGVVANHDRDRTGTVSAALGNADGARQRCKEIDRSGRRRQRQASQSRPRRSTGRHGWLMRSVAPESRGIARPM